MLNAQRQNRRSPALCGPQGTLCSHIEWLAPRWGHQGCDCILSLLWECFWWSGMTNQVQQSIKSWTYCLQHEGYLPKVPLHLIVSTALMDHLHVDITSIKMTMELNRLPKIANILVFQDHFAKHIMAYVIPNQTKKTVAKFVYQGHISIFGVPTRLLSGHGVNFMSNIISEMCKLLSMRKLCTIPYHHQMNGLVERSHQTIMWMIEKLGKDKKANWPGYLAEIVHAYNATQSTVMGYSQHYLMFACRTRLKECRGPQARHLCKVCGWKCSHCSRAVEGHPSWGPGPVYGRGSKTEMLLQLQNRCHRTEAW